MSAVIRGQQGVIEGQTVATYKIGAGGTTVKTFTGPSDAILNKAAELQVVGWQTEVTTGPVYTLKATLSIDILTNPSQVEIPDVMWEVSSQPVQQDVMECWDRNIVSGLSTQTKDAIRARIKKPETLMPILGEDQIGDQTALTQAERVFALLQMGVEARRVFSLELKRTIVVSRNYTLNWSINNVSKILSRDKLINLYAVPANIQSILPPSGWNSVPIVAGDWASATNGTNFLEFFTGYMEQHPNYQLVANNRVQVSQGWVFSTWSAGDDTGLYDVIE